MKNKALILIILTMGLISCSTTKRQVEKLFSESKTLKDKTFYYEQLSRLPEPVQAYFQLNRKIF